MDIFNTMLTDWWEANGKDVKNEIEDRTGQRPDTNNRIECARRDFDDVEGNRINCAVLMFNGDPVALVTVDWGEPLIKISYV